MATPMTAAQWKAQMTKWRCRVTYRTGWETHGRPNRPWGGVNGIIVHHTGSDTNTSAYVNALFATQGMRYPDLPGPLCHASTGPDGNTTIGATRRANHAGAGTQRTFDHVVLENYAGLTSELSPGGSSGVDGNTHFYGNEVRFSGSHAMTTAQYEAVVSFCAAICDFHGWSALSVIGHREWTTAKWDPGRTPMAALRTAVAARLKAGPSGTGTAPTPVVPPAPTPDVPTTPAPAVPPAVPPPPAPAPTYVAVRTDFLNVAGYNAHGQATWRTRTALIGGDILNAHPDTFATAELSNLAVAKMRPMLDGLLTAAMTRSGFGTDGRYVYRSKSLKRITSGNRTLPTKYGGDDKQIAFLVFEKLGARGLDVTFHLESDNGPAADQARVAQALEVTDIAVKIANQYATPLNNVLLIGDTNSENLVRQALANRGWKSVGIGTDQETSATFNSWGDRSTRIDYGFVRNGVPITNYHVVNKVSRSDHARISTVRKLIKPT